MQQLDFFLTKNYSFLPIDVNIFFSKINLKLNIKIFKQIIFCKEDV